MLKEYFKKYGLSEADTTTRIKCRDIWYCIIDAANTHTAIMKIMEENPNEWDGFQLRVTLLLGGHTMSIYLQLARVQNEHHSKSYYIELTLYNFFSGIIGEFDRLTNERNGKKPTEVEVSRKLKGMYNLK